MTPGSFDSSYNGGDDSGWVDDIVVGAGGGGSTDPFLVTTMYDQFDQTNFVSVYIDNDR